jgi:cytosine/adenosine deaminase-related metal-dependent hydrolase
MTMPAGEIQAPVAVDTIVTGAWVITLNSAREIYSDGAVAIIGGVIVEIGKRTAAAEMIRFGTTLFEEPGCNHLPAVLEALDETRIRARIGPWTWDQAGAAGRADLPDWLSMDADTALVRLSDGIDTCGPSWTAGRASRRTRRRR